jgi:hypothetical protein
MARYAGDPTGPTPASVVPKAAAPAVLEAFKDEDSYIRIRAISSVDIVGVDPKHLKHTPFSDLQVGTDGPELKTRGAGASRGAQG